MTEVVHRSRADDREQAVFDRIEAFRRRRPRLLDNVVTLAHGAGGKATAALLDAVFLRPEERAAAEALAARMAAPFTGLWLQALPEVMAQRIDARTGDASDADSEAGSASRLS